MIIKVTDIPPAGKDYSFDISNEALNARISAAKANLPRDSVDAPAYEFSGLTTGTMRLEPTSNSAEGPTILAKGKADGVYRSLCARCAEDTEKALHVDILLMLKPFSPQAAPQSQDEDLGFAHYRDKEIDCSALAEDFLVLALPFTVLCTENCKGLCPRCGANLNRETCACTSKKEGDERFAVLRGLKLTS